MASCNNCCQQTIKESLDLGYSDTACCVCVSKPTGSNCLRAQDDCVDIFSDYSTLLVPTAYSAALLYRHQYLLCAFAYTP